MKKILSTSLLFCILLLHACQHEKQPMSVVTISATSEDDEKIFASAAILFRDINISEGGFCYSKTNKNPDHSGKYVLLYGIDNEFHSSIKDVKGGDSVYVRAFVKNKDEYVYGQTVRAYVQKSLNPEVPCTHELNKVSLDSVVYTAKAYRQDLWPHPRPRLVVEFNNSILPSLELEFMDEPKPGIYTSGHGYDYGEKTVSAVFIWSSGAAVEDGHKIFVSRNSDGSFTFDFCNLKIFIIGGQARVLNGKVKTYF